MLAGTSIGNTRQLAGNAMPMNLDRLLAVAGPALGRPQTSAQLEIAGIPAGLSDLLSRRNGFVAFESALRVFPLGQVSDGSRDLRQWNDPALWKTAYPTLDAAQDLFFAEDAFGGQFGLRHEAVYSFDPETGESELVSNSVEEWAGRVLADFNILTGYALAHAWQQEHGPIRSGCRLVPTTPFVLGGDFSVSNLKAVDAVQGMRWRGRLATQLQGLPDGTKVTLKVVS
jgi:hypothetical protein